MENATHKMDTGHDCCKKVVSQEKGDHTLTATAKGSCDAKTISAALASASEATPDLSVEINVLPISPFDVPHFVLYSVNPYFDSGPPRFLSLQRLLI
jgi:hypothetical protein